MLGERATLGKPVSKSFPTQRGVMGRGGLQLQQGDFVSQPIKVIVSGEQSIAPGNYRGGDSSVKKLHRLSFAPKLRQQRTQSNCIGRSEIVHHLLKFPAIDEQCPISERVAHRRMGSHEKLSRSEGGNIEIAALIAG